MKKIKIFEAFVDSYNPDNYPETWNKDEIQMLVDHGFEIDTPITAHVKLTPDDKAYIKKDYSSSVYSSGRELNEVYYTVWFDKKSFFETRLKKKNRSMSYNSQPDYLPHLQQLMDWIYIQATKKGLIKYDANNYYKDK